MYKRYQLSPFIGIALAIVLISVFLSGSSIWPTVALQTAHAASAQPPTLSAPINKTWYFAEGRVGNGFREYLTIENPSNTSCMVNINYNYATEGSTTTQNKTVALTVGAYSRGTEAVNLDLGAGDFTKPALDVASIVSVNAGTTPLCKGVVAERPMYFSNYHGLSTGTDVIGATHLSTSYYFADVPSGLSYSSFITLLNPNITIAHVTVNYYANGHQVATQSVQVSPNSRGTITPGSITPALGHAAAVVNSDQPIMAERPTYFSIGGVTGAYDVVGVPAPAQDWLFAEGYTGTSYSEYLTIANIDPANKVAMVHITLKSQTGQTATTTLTVPAQSQTIWNVNNANTFVGSSPQVSAEVTSSGTNIVVQREMYFNYMHTLPNVATGGTDVMGQVGPAAHSSYSFAEGYSNTGYNEWLTVQNPTGASEAVSVTLVNTNGQSLLQTINVGANSRYTQDITAWVQQLMHAGTSSGSNEVSMTVSTLNGSVFVAERTMYWNTQSVSSFITRGGTDVVGYVGG